MCAAIARQAQEAGRRVSREKKWAELQARRNGRYEKNRTRSYINGSTATANLRKRRTLFLRKLRSSYGILTDERNSYVLCYGYGYDNGYGNGYGVLEIRHKRAKTNKLITYRSESNTTTLYVQLYISSRYKQCTRITENITHSLTYVDSFAQTRESLQQTRSTFVTDSRPHSAASATLRRPQLAARCLRSICRKLLCAVTARLQESKLSRVGRDNIGACVWQEHASEWLPHYSTTRRVKSSPRVA